MPDLVILIIVAAISALPTLFKKMKESQGDMSPDLPPEDEDNDLEDEPVFQPRRPSPAAPSPDTYEEMLRRAAAARTEAARRAEMLRRMQEAAQREEELRRMQEAAQREEELRRMQEAAQREEMLRQKRMQEAARAADNAPVATSAQVVSQSLATAYPQAIKTAKATRPGIHRPTRVSARGRRNVRQAVIMSEVIARPRAFDL